jgi:cell division protein FtsZ
MGDEVRITVVATGFDNAEPRSRMVRAASTVSAAPTSEPVEFPVPAFDKDDLEIPAFLRRRN